MRRYRAQLLLIVSDTDRAARLTECPRHSSQSTHGITFLQITNVQKRKEKKWGGGSMNRGVPGGREGVAGGSGAGE